MLVNDYFLAVDNEHEAVPLSSEGFPYVCIRTELDRYADKRIHWHWHSAFEIAYLAEGTLTVQTPDNTLYLEKGDAVFINSGSLHTYYSEDNVSSVIYAQLFDMHFLTGMYNSVFEEKYCHSILRNTNLQAWKIHPEDKIQVRMIAEILNGIDLAVQEPEGYEFEIRAELSRFWIGLLKVTAAVRRADSIQNNSDIKRIKKMMDYIGEHYPDRLMLEDIASAADISVRECTRCFRKCINLTPKDYLTQTRIRKAAILLEETDQSILEVSENCGFSSASYFGKVFRDTYGITPNEYRRNKQ